MTGKILFRFVVFGLFLCFVAACAPISKEYRQEAMVEDTTFPSVQEDPDAYVGRMIVWGGTIISTTNTQDGTEIVVMETPLGVEERPAQRRGSRGRFIAKSSKFLDPEVYRTGREVTLAGEVAGKKTLTLGNAEVKYPVVAVQQLHLWKKTPERYPMGGYNPNPGWTGPFGYYDEFSGNIGMGMIQGQSERR